MGVIIIILMSLFIGGCSLIFIIELIETPSESVWGRTKKRPGIHLVTKGSKK